MSGPAPQRFWQRPRRASCPAVPHEPADLGTAFGMEVSLDEAAYTPSVARDPGRTKPKPWWKAWTRNR